MALLNNAALKAGCRINVLLRLSSGNQFGMDEKTLKELLGRREDYTKVRVRGLQFFSGTQKTSLKKHRKELALLDDFVDEVFAQTGDSNKRNNLITGVFQTFSSFLEGFLNKNTNTGN